MQIRYLKNHEIDKRRWDQCISQAHNEIIFAYSWYLDAVSYGWEAMILDDYDAVFPLPVRFKFVHYVYTPFMISQLGIFSKVRLSSVFIAAFLSHIPKKYKWIDLSFNLQNKLPGTIQSKKKPTYLLDLSTNYEQLFASYSKNTKRNIKKAWKSDLFLNKNTPPEDVIDLFIKEGPQKYLKGLTKGHFALLRKLVYQLMYRNTIHIYGAFSQNNELLAGMFITESRKGFIFLFSGNSEAGKKCGAMHYIIDQFIKEKAGVNKYFDFEGSVDPGLARFYGSFGSARKEYDHVIINRLPWYFLLIAKIFKKA